MQLGLEAWLSRDGRTHKLVGLTGFQHRMFSLADLAQPETVVHGPGLGSVAMANQPSGPGGQTYPCVQCALYLVGDHLAAALDRLLEEQNTLTRLLLGARRDGHPTIVEAWLDPKSVAETGRDGIETT